MRGLGRGIRWLTLAVWLGVAGGGAYVLISPVVVTQEVHGGPRQSATRERTAASGEERERLDPAAWGSDHVGEALPDYVDSGECLFCHRNDIGATWSKDDRHSRTIRLIDEDAEAKAALAEKFPEHAEAAGLVMGHVPHVKFLRRAEAYGKMDLLSLGADRRLGRRVRLERGDKAEWQVDMFNNECAGCHTTGLDPESLTYATVSLDCFSCHGDAPLEHANEPELMPLAEAREDPAEVVTSICASCHVRFGGSKSTGRPFPDNFVAGDNLFRDYAFDFDLADDESLNPADRHVLDNVREVAVYGNGQVTCLSCHEVHANSTERHRELERTTYCAHCHEPDEPLTKHKVYDVHSERCRY